MRHVRKHILLLLLIGFGVQLAQAQSISTQGKDFWLSFMQNGYYENNTGNINGGMIAQLTISAKRNCQVSITNPNYPDWSLNLQVQANSILEEIIPKQYCYHLGSDNETVSDKGIHVVATDTISVYCANIANYSFDASFVLPTGGLGNDYIIQCSDQSTLNNVGSDYKRLNQTSAFLIVATEDNTVVNITPTVTTLGGHAAGQTFQVSLNAGQTYHIRSNNTTEQRDLSGSRVIADDCKKIAVFNGNTLTRLPLEYTSGNTGFDHIFEQAMPIHSWGKRFVVTQSKTRKRDFVKVVSGTNGNEIRKNGQVIATLNAHQSHTFQITSTEGSCYLEATQPCAVYLYNTSANDDPNNTNGDPSMVWIAPIEQRIDEVTFATFSHHDASIDDHYVNIIVKTEDINHVTFDGNTLASNEFSQVNGNPDYSFARKSISHGTHHLACANGFNAHVYGFGNAKGYAYLVGSNAIDLNIQLNIDGIDVAESDTIRNCSLDPIVFKAELNYSNYDITWDFGDGTTSHDETAQHSYPENSIYEASFTIHINETGCIESDEIAIHFVIDTRREEDEEYCADACIGTLYSGYGFENVPIEGDTVLSRVKESNLPENCRGYIIVHVTAHQQGYELKEDTICFTGAGIYEYAGVNIAYDHPGVFDTVVPFSTGSDCESTIEFHLQIDSLFESHDTINGLCNEYFWMDTLLTDSGDFTRIFTSSNGCDSIVHLNLKLNHPPDPSPIFPCDTNNLYPHWVITPTEFQINWYEFHLWDNNEDWQWDSVTWTIDTPSANLWELRPDPNTIPVGKRCKVMVMNHVEDTVWLTATVFNQCTDTMGVSRRYWLTTSFYGLEEHGDQPDFSIVPNPNNGQMSLNFMHLTGEIDIKVYDMKGTLIDQFQSVSTADCHTLPYTLKGQSTGIYLFVITNQGRTLTKKALSTN